MQESESSKEELLQCLAVYTRVLYSSRHVSPLRVLLKLMGVGNISSFLKSAVKVSDLLPLCHFQGRL